MSRHLSSRRISLYLSGRAHAQDLRHAQKCFVRRPDLARLESSLAPGSRLRPAMERSSQHGIPRERIDHYDAKHRKR
jgi:hypothetical protein